MFAKINEKREGFTLIELLIVVAIIGILAAIAIPQYAKYRRGAQDNAAQSAYHAVATSQEAYYALEGKYVDKYASLGAKGGLTKDSNVWYGPLTLTSSTDGTGTAGFAFKVRHMGKGSTTYLYNSVSTSTVITYPETDSNALTTNSWT
jgi:prepilin-type N-terminal cleavage/methylation domain-containing protein